MHALRILSLAFITVLTALAARAQPAPTVTWLTPPNPQWIGGFGMAIAGVGDTNGDGVGDVLVGAPESYDPVLGAAFLFNGDGAYLRELEPAVYVDWAPFGHAVAPMGDLDGDGHADLLVGHDDIGVLTYSGATGDLLEGWPLSSAEALTGGADFDGDGDGDFVAGAPYAEDGFGAAALRSGLTGDLLRLLTSPAPVLYGEFGHAVCVVDDLDGDGQPDVLVGAPSEGAGGERGNGRVHAFSGATGALLYTLASPNNGGAFGHAVTGVSDVDGDGVGDLLIGASYETVDGLDGAGRAYVFSGASGDLLRTLASSLPEDGGEFGAAVAHASDVDGDGVGDLVVGAPWEGSSSQGSGQAYVFSGATGALLHTLLPSTTQYYEFAGSLANVGDLDGDGMDEVAVGEPVQSRVYVYAFAAVTPAVEPPAEQPLATVASPNPATGRSAVAFTLGATSAVRLVLYDVLGREVAAVAAGRLPAGTHRLALDLSALPAGVYVWRLSAGSTAETGRLTVAR